MTTTVRSACTTTESLKMFDLLRMKFKRVKFGLGSWAVESDDPIGKLYLKLLWADGSVCQDSGDYYFEFFDKELPFVATTRTENSAQEAWNFFEKEYLANSYLQLDPFFKLGERPEKLGDYKKSYLRVTNIGKEVVGLTLPDLHVNGWEDYFPSGFEFLPARWSRQLISELINLEEAGRSVGTHKKYTQEEVDSIKVRIDEYKIRLHVLG